MEQRTLTNTVKDQVTHRGGLSYSLRAEMRVSKKFDAIRDISMAGVNFHSVSGCCKGPQHLRTPPSKAAYVMQKAKVKEQQKAVEERRISVAKTHMKVYISSKDAGKNRENIRTYKGYAKRVQDGDEEENHQDTYEGLGPSLVKCLLFLGIQDGSYENTNGDTPQAKDATDAGIHAAPNPGDKNGKEDEGSDVHCYAYDSKRLWI
nr:hypothetical protein [Tanacetum cinerariifolium]